MKLDSADRITIPLDLWNRAWKLHLPEEGPFSEEGYSRGSRVWVILEDDRTLEIAREWALKEEGRFFTSRKLFSVRSIDKKHRMCFGANAQRIGISREDIAKAMMFLEQDCLKIRLR